MLPTEGQRPAELLLIFGPSTSGKTTLARRLVQSKLYAGMLEGDDFFKNATGFDDPLALDPNLVWSGPILRGALAMKNAMIAAAVKAYLSKGISLAVSGVWPGEVDPILQRVQDYRAIVLWIPRIVARQRWQLRGGKLKDFEAIFPEATWDDHWSRFNKLASMLRRRNKLIMPTDSNVIKHVWEETGIIFGEPDLDPASSTLSMGRFKGPPLPRPRPYAARRLPKGAD